MLATAPRDDCIQGDFLRGHFPPKNFFSSKKCRLERHHSLSAENFFREKIDMCSTYAFTADIGSFFGNK